jgi:transposase InsO family protein
MSFGLNRDTCLDIVDLTRNQFYYELKGTKPGRSASNMTLWRDPVTLEEDEVDNAEVVKKIVEIKLNPDLSNWYKLITVALKIMGYYINHKKVYRLMFEYLILENKRNRTGREFVKYRRVTPSGPLRVLEMDIKYFWIHEKRRYAFVLTIIDTFTRYVLHWAAGYTMKSEQVKRVWEFVVAEYLQQADISLEEIDIDVVVRSDNGKQFNSEIMSTFFKENNVRHEFTRPYTPEENGHVESFHSILGKALKRDRFTSLGQLEERLEKFYKSYNNDRSHSGTKGVPPAKFWALYDLEKVEVIYLKNRAQQFRLKVAYQDILTLPDIHKYQYRVIRA